MNLDATQERYLFVNFHGLRVTFPFACIVISRGKIKLNSVDYYQLSEKTV
jgi:hypothetical protein